MNATQKRPIAVSAGSRVILRPRLRNGDAVRLPEYELEAIEAMRALAAHGYTPSATARVIASRKGIEVASLEVVARAVKHHDPELQNAHYSIGAFDIGDGRRGGNLLWQRALILLNSARDRRERTHGA